MSGSAAAVIVMALLVAMILGVVALGVIVLVKFAWIIVPAAIAGKVFDLFSGRKRGSRKK